MGEVGLRDNEVGGVCGEVVRVGGKVGEEGVEMEEVVDVG